MIVKFKVPAAAAASVSLDLLNGFIKKLSEADELLLSKIDASLKNHKHRHKHKIHSLKLVSVEIDDALFIKLKQRFANTRLQKILEFAYLIIIITHFRRNELEYGNFLFKANEGWAREVRTKSGYIDGLNFRLKKIVELKFIAGWKSALGQILSYVSDSPSKYEGFSKEIWLICDKISKKNKGASIIKVCEKFEVEVVFIDIDAF